MKRLISTVPSDLKAITSESLEQSIASSAGRVIMGETVVTAAPLIEGLTNAEVMVAFGADLILLNEFDVFDQYIEGLYPCENPIAEIKHLCGQPVGINLEAVDQTAEVADQKVVISKGRLASKETFQKAQNLGIDFIVITGNPSTGVSNQAIKQAVPVGKKYYEGLIFAGKMHSAGLNEAVIDVDGLIELGADGVLVLSVNTVPGVNETDLSDTVKAVHENEGLVIAAIGTSQESADLETIREIGLSNKRIGADIHHIGDGGFGRMPDPENILTLGKTIRGKRHTYYGTFVESLKREDSQNEKLFSAFK